MRNLLGKEEGKRKKFRAVIDRLGKKINYKGYSEETVLLKNVVDVEMGKAVAGHLWFSLTKGLEKISLESGTQIEFEARVKEYTKGYVNKAAGINQSKTDYKLSHPTKIRRIG